MGILGSIGTAIGSGIGKAAGGIEGGATLGVAGAASVSGLARFDTMFGPKMGSIMPEGGSLMGAKNFGTLDLIGGTSKPGFSPVGGEILFQAEPETSGTIASVENFLAQAKMPKVEPMIMPQVEPLVYPKLPSWEVIAPQEMPQVEPMVAPWVLPAAEPSLYPGVSAKPRTIVEEAEAVAKQAWDNHVITQAENVVNSMEEESPVVLPQPVPEEQILKEEVVTERATAKQIDIVEEEMEKAELKDVVDEPVLSTRIEEFSYAAELAGAEMEEIDGKRVVELVGPETPDKRSGLVKKNGPDGSWIETVWVVASKKFRSVREAKEKIVKIIAQKVPVKKAKEGIAVGYEAVARVLRHFFIKAAPSEQTVTRATKKQQTKVVPIAAPKVTGPRIEDFGLAEVFAQVV